ncbi:MAG: RiPP maturation radical SAM C-methyltransferase [Acidimicrobiales bacterium]
MGTVGRANDVALVTMPFAPLPQPSLALSLLKGMLEPGRARIFYETIRFAEEIGSGLYDRVTDGLPVTTHLVGDWLFAEAAFGADDARDRAYVDRFLSPARAIRERAGRETTVDADVRDELLDCRAQIDSYLDRALERVLSYEPTIVGFTSVFQQHVGSLALARRIKETRPDTTIVMGGANCEGPMGLALLRNYDWIDAVVSGEGEVPFRTIVDHVTSGGPIHRVGGVTTRHDVGSLALVNDTSTPAETLDLDALPVPDYDDFFEQWNRSTVSEDQTPFLLFESARGCWWGALRHCTFCGLNGDRMAFRSKSANRAVDELCQITSKHPGLPVYAVDNIIDRDYFDEFLPALAESTCTAPIFYEVKANLSKSQLVLLRDAGVRDIQPGIESLHDSVLRIMRKGVTALGNIQLLKWCAELGLRPHWNILWGFPGEPAEAFEDMTALIPHLVHLRPPDGAGPIRLDRFSPNFDDAAELGFTNVRPVPAYEAVYGLDDRSHRELAYFFDFDSAHDRHDAEAERLRTAIADWQERHETSGLWALDDGEVLTVWDFRWETSTSTTCTGAERGLMLALDSSSSLRDLVTLPACTARSMTEVEVEAVLDDLNQRGLVITDGRRWLGLPVLLGDRTMPVPFLARMVCDAV